MPRGFSGGGGMRRPTASLFQVHHLGEKTIPEEELAESMENNEVDTLADWVDSLLETDMTSEKGDTTECTAVTALTDSPPKLLPAVLEQAAIWGAIDPTATKPIEGVKPAASSGFGKATEGTPLEGGQQQNDEKGGQPNLLSWMEKIFKGDQQHQQHQQQKQQAEQQRQQEQEQKRLQQQTRLKEAQAAGIAAPATQPPLQIEHGEQVIEFLADTRITAVLSDGAFGYSASELVGQSLLDLAYSPQRQELFHALQVLHRMGEIQNLMVAGLGAEALPRQSIRCIHHVVVRVQQRVQLLAMDSRITLTDASCSPAKLLLRSRVLGPPDCVGSFRMVPVQ